MNDIWREWDELRHEWSRGNGAQELIINKMERVVENAIARVRVLQDDKEQLIARVRELEAQAARYRTSLLDLAIEIGGCTCGPEYTGRGLIAPNCAWHQSSTPEILEEAGLLGEYQARLDAALAARGRAFGRVVQARADTQGVDRLE